MYAAELRQIRPNRWGLRQFQVPECRNEQAREFQAKPNWNRHLEAPRIAQVATAIVRSDLNPPPENLCRFFGVDRPRQ